MSDLRALLVTDVVDSTRLSETLGDAAMAALWARHDRVARDLLPAHSGREIDKTDGFLMLFDQAEDAVAYAVAYHRALASLEPPIQARAGVHLGPVILTENAPSDVARGAKPLEVDGLAKPTAARVMSVALGGQTLVTAPVVDALGSAALRVESHGHWRMKGVAEPIELFEVGEAGAPFTPPPDGAKVYRVVDREGIWLPAREVAHSLPAERDAFIGREADLLELAARLDEGARLVSVLGIGGTGKTRLVTRFAWTWLGDWPGGAWFCDLSEARDLEGIASAVARALDVPLAQGDPIAQLGHAIAGRGRCLVVLDNFEQVTRDAAQTLGRWLDRAHEAQFVVTTREVLGLPGEVALSLSPLDPGDGVRLFEARARAARREFAMTDDEREHVVALVRQLDGLPLAIELAAARVRVMPPKVILERLKERFKLLASTGGRHTRQSTLRAALDWSWDLLSEDEQSALAQLSVFEGGFALEAAEAVLSLPDLWPTDAVQALVDKSLVRSVSEERFDLLVSVQVYAAEKLDALGGRAEAEARHGAFFGALGGDGTVGTVDFSERRRVLVREHDNLLTACRRAIARADGALATAALGAAWEVLELRGPSSVGATLAAAVLGMALTTRDRGRALRIHGKALSYVGRMGEARTELEAGLAAARDAADRRTEGSILGLLAAFHRDQDRKADARDCNQAALAVAREAGDRRVEFSALIGLGALLDPREPEARATLEAAFAVSRALGDRRLECIALATLGTQALARGDLGESRRFLEGSLAIAREVGDRRSEAHALGNLGSVCLARGEWDQALAYGEAVLALSRAVGGRVAEGTSLANLGGTLRHLGRPDEARSHLEAALVIARELGNLRQQAYVLGVLGSMHQASGDLATARERFEAAAAVAHQGGLRGMEGAVLGTLGRVHLLEGRTGEARASFAEAERVLRASSNTMELGRMLCGRIELHVADGDLDRARADLAEAEALAEQLGARPESVFGQDLAQARAIYERART